MQIACSFVVWNLYYYCARSSEAHEPLDMARELFHLPTLQAIPCMSHRQAALEVTKAAAIRILSAEALQSEVGKAQKVLEGSTEGRIKNATERAALAAFIAALCPPEHQSLQSCAEQTASSLADIYK